MIIKRLFGGPLHEHPDPAQRALGASALPPASTELVGLLAGDPEPEVRAAAARCCTSVEALAAAWRAETDAAVRAVIASVLGPLLAGAVDEASVRALLADDALGDAIRADVARLAPDAGRRDAAIAAVRDEGALVDLALGAEHAETRMAAAERVHTTEGLARLAEAARDKDRGVARLARRRLDALRDHAGRSAAADEVLTELELLAGAPGPILSAVVDLDRRWNALDLAHDADRVARWQAVRQALLARFDREREAQQARAQFERRLGALLASDAPATTAALDAQHGELAALETLAASVGDAASGPKLDEARRRLDAWAGEIRARADAEALVAEAELLAAGTSIDDGGLPERWQALERAMRTPALTRRFEAAMVVVAQRRIAQAKVAEQEAINARQEVHHLLHVAEQALARGEVQAARAAADALKARKPDAGPLPKPTLQRIGRLVHQLVELERWESFGQHSARTGLCERAEALIAAPMEARRLAAEVQKLRAEWKTLDQQHAGVPKSLWERFDRACETAYAPAARHFHELAVQRKEARAQRDAFIQAAAEEAQARLQEPRDWRAIEHWLRDKDRAWRDGSLGSVEPKAWGKLEARFRAATAPLRDALATARHEARAGRQALIDEAAALLAHASERDAPSRVKALQAAWQAQAKAVTLAQRDERPLWEKFRAACNAVFEAREAKRKEEDAARHDGHRALEEICVALGRLAEAADKDDAEIRRSARELEDRWRERGTGADPALRRIEARFRDAKAAVSAALAARARSREASVWQTLAAKERLCEELDAVFAVPGSTPDEAAAAAVRERWAALPSLPSAWEKPLLARRDAALAAASQPDAVPAYAARVERGSRMRGEILLELEVALGLDSPPELKAQRLALQVKQLRERFQTAASATAVERLLAWCAAPGVADARDRQRCERVVAAVGLAEHRRAAPAAPRDPPPVRARGRPAS